MLLVGINHNIITTHTYYLGVYQYEAKNDSFNKRYIFLGSEPNQNKTDKRAVNVCP